MDARQILDHFRIKIRAERHGNQKTTCPECSHLRKHKADPCLSVLIDKDGVFFNCKNCGWKGGRTYEFEPGSNGVLRKTGDRSRGRRTYGDLQREARRQWR